jgi:hypothetical protein
MNNIAISFGSSNTGIMNYTYKVSKKIIFSFLSVNIFVLNGEQLKDKFNKIGVEHQKS